MGRRDGQAGFLKEPQTDDTLSSLRLTAERELGGGVFSSIEFGFNYSDREKTKVSIENFVDLIGGNDTLIQVPAEYLQAPTALDFLGFTSGVLSYDPLALLASGDIYELRPLLNSDVIIKSWGVHELVTTAYTQLNVDSVMWGAPVTGNVGIQLIQTDQTSTGGVSTASGPQDRGSRHGLSRSAAEHELVVEVADGHQLRLGIARTLARPRMDDLARQLRRQLQSRQHPLHRSEPILLGRQRRQPVSEALDRQLV